MASHRLRVPAMVSRDVQCSLVLRGTFIDVQSKRQDDSLSPRECASDPGCQSDSHSGDVFIEEREYVEDLSQKFEVENIVDYIVSNARHAMLKRMIVMQSGQGMLEQEQLVDEQVCHSPLACIQNTACSLLESDKLMYPRKTAELPGSQAVGKCCIEATNPGSRGHPDLCCKPCRFFAMGQCRNATECQFCHGEHKHGRQHMDRRRRDLLQGATAMERVQFLLPIARNKAKLLEYHNNRIAEPLDAVHAMLLQEGELSCESIACKKLRPLEYNIAFQSLYSVLSLLCNTNLSDNHHVIKQLLNEAMMAAESLRNATSS